MRRKTHEHNVLTEMQVRLEFGGGLFATFPALRARRGVSHLE